MRLAVGADHAGFALKEELIRRLRGAGHELVDVRTFDAAMPVDNRDYAEAVGNVVTTDRVSRGVLLCGSGIGASISANKIPGIRAGLCHDAYSARQGVEHDDMNVIVLGARVIGVEIAWTLVVAFLGATFSGEARHVRRLEKLRLLKARHLGVGTARRSPL